jgi:hypothetical protein
VLADGSTKNGQFRAKTDRNWVFLGRDPHIADRLYIIVPYMSFYGFWKNSNFRSKFIGVTLRFCRNSPVWAENWPKLSICWSWTPYCGSVIHNGHVYVFLHILKNHKFLVKIHKLADGFTENHPFVPKTDWNTVFLGCDSHILDRLYITVPYINFYGFWKNSIFCSKSVDVRLRFYWKSLV